MKNTNFSYVIILLLLAGSLCFPQQQKLNVYGFFDVEAIVNNKDAAGKRWSFDQHHLNFLVNYQLDDRFRVATEIDYEHGPVFSSAEITGKMYVGKAFLEYKYSDALLARIGIFLSPFGIYNERHDATPTFLFTFLPHSVYNKRELSFGVKGRLFAKQSTGIQVLGNLSYLVKPIKQSFLYSKIISVFSTERKNDKPERGKMLFDPKMVDKHPLRILIADDNVINQKVAERMLQKMGYRPDIVSNGLEILQALEQAPYDLIFIDVHMPEMDGLEATRRICDKYSKDNRPLLVAMTADAMPGDKEKCIEAGMDDYICKPVKIPELEKALKKAFILKLAAEQKI